MKRILTACLFPAVLMVIMAAFLPTISRAVPTVQAGIFYMGSGGPASSLLTVRGKVGGGDLTTSVSIPFAFIVTVKYLTSYGISVAAPTGSYGVILDATVTNGSWTYKIYSTVTTTTQNFLNNTEYDLFSIVVSGGTGYGSFYVLNDAVTMANNSDWYFEYGANDYTNYVTPFYAGTASTVPLPVQLVLFRGTRSQDNVTLDWKTVSEMNNSGFYVERSTDNTAWKQLDFVQGHGTTDQPQEYTYVDNLHADIAALNALYYRLRQMDREGKFTFSDIVAVANREHNIPIADAETAFLLTPYPNPFSGGAFGNATTFIPFRLDREQSITLYITNSAGEVVQWIYANEMLPAGYYQREFNASALPSGTYFTILESQGHIVKQQLVYTK